jgi:hypothetical protein
MRVERKKGAKEELRSDLWGLTTQHTNFNPSKLETQSRCVLLTIAINLAAPSKSAIDLRFVQVKSYVEAKYHQQSHHHHDHYVSDDESCLADQFSFSKFSWGPSDTPSPSCVVIK